MYAVLIQYERLFSGIAVALSVIDGFQTLESAYKAVEDIRRSSQHITCTVIKKG